MENKMTLEIADVYDMGTAELNAKFEELYGFPPGQTSIVTIRNRIIYRIQELHLDGVSLEDREFLKSIKISCTFLGIPTIPLPQTTRVCWLMKPTGSLILIQQVWEMPSPIRIWSKAGRQKILPGAWDCVSRFINTVL